MNRPCDVGIQCVLFPGEFDSPVLNFSSEAPDPLLFFPPVFNFPNTPIVPRLGATEFPVYNCDGFTYSVLSQEYAELLTRLNQLNCNGTSNIFQCLNDEQSASTTCPDGSSTFTYKVAAGLFGATITPVETGPNISFDACHLAANEQALAYAQQKASDLADKFCLNSSNRTGKCPSGQFLDPITGICRNGVSPIPPIDPNSPLFPIPSPNLQTNSGWCCLGQQLNIENNTYTITGPNAMAHYEFEISAGSLPPGTHPVQYDFQRAVIVGTPTVAGIYAYTMKATRVDAPSLFVEVQDTIRVLGFNSANPPNTIDGTVYSFDLLPAGATTFTVDISAGALPNGLSVDNAGLISGTINDTGSFAFTARITDSDGNSCLRSFTLFVDVYRGPLTWHFLTLQGNGAFTSSGGSAGGSATGVQSAINNGYVQADYPNMAWSGQTLYLHITYNAINTSAPDVRWGVLLIQTNDGGSVATVFNQSYGASPTAVVAFTPSGGNKVVGLIIQWGANYAAGSAASMNWTIKIKKSAV